MKKRTQEEKLKMVNEACTLFNEAITKAREAQKLLHLCGIEICERLDIDEEIWNDRFSNVQIFSGISNLEKIVGEQGYYPNMIHEEKPDRSRKMMKLNGIMFTQLANESECKFVFR